MMDFIRYREMLAEHAMKPFDRDPWINPRTGRMEAFVLGEVPAMRWRVSPDEWDRILAHVEDIAGAGNRASPTMAAKLYGWPIKPDEALPPNSIIFEPATA